MEQAFSNLQTSARGLDKASKKGLPPSIVINTLDSFSQGYKFISLNPLEYPNYTALEHGGRSLNHNCW